MVTGVVPSPPPGSCLHFFIAHRVQQSRCSSIFYRMLLTHALALSASQSVHNKKSLRIYSSMHPGGLELTKLTYTGLEDNLIRHRGDLFILIPSWFVVCGHHLSPTIAIVCSLLFSLPNSSMSHRPNFLTSSSNACRYSLNISHSLTMWVLLSVVVPHGYIVVATSSSPLLVRVYLFFLVGPGPLHEIAVSAFSRSPFGRADTFSFQHLPSTPHISLIASPISHYFLALAFSFLLLFLQLLSCTRQASL